MKHLLIVGGGNAARRFVEALDGKDIYAVSLASFGRLGKTVRLAGEYGIPCQSFDAFSAEKFQGFACIVMCVPIDAKYELTRRIIETGFSGALILEKPLALCCEEVAAYERLLTGRGKYLVGYDREFMCPPYIWQGTGNMDIVWPSVFTDVGASVAHDLPHLLNWLLDWGFEDIRLNYIGGETLFGTADDRRVRVHFSNRVPAIAWINGHALPSPDHYELKVRMLGDVMSYSAERSAATLERSRKIAEIISKIRSTDYGYQDT